MKPEEILPLLAHNLAIDAYLRERIERGQCPLCERQENNRKHLAGMIENARVWVASPQELNQLLKPIDHVTEGIRERFNEQIDRVWKADRPVRRFMNGILCHTRFADIFDRSINPKTD